MLRLVRAGSSRPILSVSFWPPPSYISASCHNNPTIPSELRPPRSLPPTSRFQYQDQEQVPSLRRPHISSSVAPFPSCHPLGCLVLLIIYLPACLLSCLLTYLFGLDRTTRVWLLPPPLPPVCLFCGPDSSSTPPPQQPTTSTSSHQRTLFLAGHILIPRQPSGRSLLPAQSPWINGRAIKTPPAIRGDTTAAIKRRLLVNTLHSSLDWLTRPPASNMTNTRAQ